MKSTENPAPYLCFVERVEVAGQGQGNVESRGQSHRAVQQSLQPLSRRVHELRMHLTKETIFSL